MLSVPTFVIELICAKAYDNRGVRATYHETLADWFGWASNAVERRSRIVFDDFCEDDLAGAPSWAAWEVLDPVAPSNNVVSAWSNWQIDTLAEWFAKGRDAWSRAIRCDQLNDDSGSLQHLVQLFGSPFKHHCDED